MSSNRMSAIFLSLLVFTIFAGGVARGEEYELVEPAPCETDPDQAFSKGLEFLKISIRDAATRCNAESTAEVVTANHHTITIDPAVPDQVCGVASHGPLPGCAWFTKKVLAGNGLAPIQESANVVRIVPLSSVKPGQPLADMSW